MRTSIAVLATTALLTLSACGGSEEEPAPADTPSSSPSAEATSEAAASAQEIAVDETIEDDVLGDTLRITGLVRDFETTEFTNITEGGGEFVLVEVDAKAGDKYSGGIKGGFKLTADGDLAGSSTTILDEEMQAAGYEPWQDLDSGEEGKGWFAFQVNTRSDAYTLEYKRMAASVIGGGKPIPEKIWKIDLPTS